MRSDTFVRRGARQGAWKKTNLLVRAGSLILVFDNGYLAQAGFLILAFENGYLAQAEVLVIREWIRPRQFQRNGSRIHRFL